MYTKMCKFCGKEFQTDTPQKQYCDRLHYKKCVDCGQYFVIPSNRINDNKRIIRCKECQRINRAIHIKEALANKPKGYNAHHQSYTKICKYCRQEFTTTEVNQLYCNRQHITTCVICGREFNIKNEGIQVYQIPKTCSEKCRQELSKQTCLDKYGSEYYASTDEARQHTSYMQPVIQSKRRQTNKDRYGVENYSSSDRWLVKYMSDPSKIDNLKLFIDDPQDFIESHFNIKPTATQLSKYLGISVATVCDRLDKMNCQNLVKGKISSMENELIELLISIKPDIEIIQHERRVIAPYELDVYLPDYQIAFECNPTYTHNSTFPSFNNDKKILHSDYHQMKTNLCNTKQIFLFHIFGYEWKYKHDIIVSMIKELLNCSNRNISIHEAQVREVDENTAKAFLDKNHWRGSTDSDIRLGAIYMGEIISLMTFNKLDNDKYELKQFCNVLNLNVIDSTLCMFGVFCTFYHPKQVISYSNRSKVNDNIYKMMDFSQIENTDPNYVLVDINTDKVQNNTEDTNNQYAKVYDSGSTLWAYGEYYL